ncbi:MAG: protein kinase [Azospirillum sp.]|nr:protein kinase [Azospirillum sp.]
MLQQGYQFDDYRIIDVLGAGGFGITYLAEDETLQVRVAIKEFMPGHIARRDGNTVQPLTGLLQPDYERQLDNFITESRNVARIQHPNVVRVRRCFRRNGTAYMVMEYEDGADFESFLKSLGRRPSQDELHRMIAPLLDGLNAVHAAGLVHRDVKPSNIYIRNGDGSPVLLDFGAARKTDASHFTAVLTSGYAPIEQYEEAASQGPWTDIYSIAAVVYRAITGNRPPAALNRLANDRLVPAAIACAGLYSDRFLAGVDRALSIQPTDRPQTIDQWQKEWLEPEARVRPAGGGAARSSGSAGGDPDPDSTLSEAASYHRDGVVRDPEADEAVWTGVQRAPSESGYRGYLASQPDGAHVAEATAALAALAETERQRKKEDVDWKRAMTLDTADAYRAYLAANPEGAHAKAARSAVSVLEDAERRRYADERAWRDATAANTVEAFEAYLAAFPLGARSGGAQTAIMALREARGRTKAANQAANDADDTLRTARSRLGAPPATIDDDLPDEPMTPEELASPPVPPGRAGPRVIAVHRTASDDDYQPRRFELTSIPVQTTVVLAFLGLIVMIFSNIMLKGVLHHTGFSNLLISIGITFGTGFAYTWYSGEVNAFTGAVASLIAAVASAVLFLLLILMVLK